MKNTKKLSVYILLSLFAFGGFAFALEQNNQRGNGMRNGDGVEQRNLRNDEGSKRYLGATGVDDRDVNGENQGDGVRLMRGQGNTEQQQNRQEKRCEIVNELISKRISIFETTKQNHALNYDKLLSRLSEISNRLKQLGFDTTTLDTDVLTLTDMVNKYKDQYQAFLTELNASSDVVCSQELTYKDKLEQTKAMLQELRSMRADIKDFYISTIRQDVVDLRNQAEELENQNTGTTEVENSNEGNQ